MGELLCQVVVNNVPENAYEWIVARWSPEDNSLWFWGSWESEEQAKEIAKFMDGILVRRADNVAR
jgi:hypothetical protein